MTKTSARVAAKSAAVARATNAVAPEKTATLIATAQPATAPVPALSVAEPHWLDIPDFLRRT